MPGDKIKVELIEYDSTCSDGCCTYWGTAVKINGEELDGGTQDTELIVKKILQHLGYDVEISTTIE